MRLLFTCIALAVPVAAQAPELTLRDVPFRLSDGREVAAEEGSFRVPVRRGAEESGELTLRFVRFASTNPEPGAPIVYLAGGPGGSGTGAAAGGRFVLFEALREVADVIAFDQRGTGRSDRLPRSPGWWSVARDAPVERAALDAAIESHAAECAEHWRAAGVDLAGYQTLASADDLEDLRRALGAERLDLVGISYGTHLALATLRRHPGAVGRVVLAGTEGLDQTLKPPRQQQALLEEIARRIDEDPRARDAYPDFLGDLERVLDDAEREPVGGVLTRFDLQRWMAGKLRGPASFVDLPQRVAEMAAGDYSVARSALPILRAGRIGAMSAAMDAASGASPARRARIAREATECLLGDAINYPLDPVRAGLGVPDLGDDFRKTFESRVPALFISGSLDGRTPPENAEETRASFAESVHWIIDGAGHGDALFLSSPDIVPGMRAFLSGTRLVDRTIDLPPLRFTLPGPPK